MDTLLEVLKEARNRRPVRHFPFDVDMYIRDSASGLYTRIYVDDGALGEKPSSIGSGKDINTTLLSFSCSKDKVHHEHSIPEPPKNYRNYVKTYHSIFIFDSKTILGPIVEAYYPVAFLPTATVRDKYTDKIIYSARLPVDTALIDLVDNK